MRESGIEREGDEECSERGVVKLRCKSRDGYIENRRGRGVEEERN